MVEFLPVLVIVGIVIIVLYTTTRRGVSVSDDKQVLVADIRNGPGDFDVDVVGESHYQDALESICNGRTEDGHELETTAYLIPESDNPHDKNAVRIEINGKTVGYLDRQTARSFRKQLQAAGVGGHVAKCDAMIVGGWDRGDEDRGHFGVKLDLPTE